MEMSWYNIQVRKKMRGSLTNRTIEFFRGVAQLGSALGSGLNHRSRRRIFEKSRKPLKTLTFSALPNVEKSSNLRSDHMFDHLQKNIVLHQSGCGSAWQSACFGSKKSQVQILSLRPFLVLYAQKISPFRKIWTDFLFIFYKPTLLQFCLFFTTAQVP